MSKNQKFKKRVRSHAQKHGMSYRAAFQHLDRRHSQIAPSVSDEYLSGIGRPPNPPDPLDLCRWVLRCLASFSELAGERHVARSALLIEQGPLDPLDILKLVDVLEAYADPLIHTEIREGRGLMSVARGQRLLERTGINIATRSIPPGPHPGDPWTNAPDQWRGLFAAKTFYRPFLQALEEFLCTVSLSVPSASIQELADFCFARLETLWGADLKSLRRLG